MKVLVTGGNGFIGRHVVAEALRRGHGLRVLTRPSPEVAASSVRSGGVEIVQQDVRHPDGLATVMEGMDAVVHCAAALDGDLATQLAVTVEGTRHLLVAMKEAGVRQIAGLSTLALYDYIQLPAGSLLDENSPLEEHFEERAPYVLAKRRQEDLIREQAGASRWRWTILRPGIVDGRGRTWFHQLGVQLGPGRWVCMAPDSVLPLTHVENCSHAIVDALEKDTANGVTLNVVDDNLPGRRRYMDALAQRTAPRPGITGISWELLDRASRMASWTNRALLFGKAPLPDLLRRASLHARCKPLRYSNERAKEVLGWTPRVNLEEGLERSFAE